MEAHKYSSSHQDFHLEAHSACPGYGTARFSANIDEHCSTYGLVETDAHLFFHCDFASAVWFSATPPLRTDSLPREDDGVQVILPLIITDIVQDSLLQKILITLWYIWKAQNDKRFARKTWTILQVHHAVAAHIATATLAASSPVQHGDSPTHNNHNLTVTHTGMNNPNAGLPQSLG